MAIYKNCGKSVVLGTSLDIGNVFTAWNVSYYVCRYYLRYITNDGILMKYSSGLSQKIYIKFLATDSGVVNSKVNIVIHGIEVRTNSVSSAHPY